ncbi:MAG: hypothetical protein HGA38_05590 [Candidatus Moranbacteria bacterium]|nr:hypothetical protein [Candidatus Moranbacteria bacterium]NTW46215.1 hypothetical protein [Candidatus Moranbacteria bacterium]
MTRGGFETGRYAAEHPDGELHVTPEGTLLSVRDESSRLRMPESVLPEASASSSSEKRGQNLQRGLLAGFAEDVRNGGFLEKDAAYVLKTLPNEESDIASVSESAMEDAGRNNPVAGLMDRIRKHPKIAVPIAALLLTISTSREAKADFQRVAKDIVGGNLSRFGQEVVDDISRTPLDALRDVRQERQKDENERNQARDRQREREAGARRALEDFRVGRSEHQMAVQRICDEFDLQFERWSISSFSDPKARNEQAARIYREYRMRVATEQARLNTFNARITHAILDGVNVRPGDTDLEMIIEKKDRVIGNDLVRDEAVKQMFRQRFIREGVSSESLPGGESSAVSGQSQKKAEDGRGASPEKKNEKKEIVSSQEKAAGDKAFLESLFR